MVFVAPALERCDMGVRFSVCLFTIYVDPSISVQTGYRNHCIHGGQILYADHTVGVKYVYLHILVCKVVIITDLGQAQKSA